MFASLEARMPFLDVDLAGFIMRLPAHLKRNKYLLRKLMRGRIPDKIIDRPKRGFSLPLGQWLRGPLWDWANESLSDKNLRELGLVKTKYVNKLLTEHQQGKADHRKKIMTLAMLHLWHQQWIKNN
jgi:asparagine synthase (glutamine-hydrolysing)